MSTYNDTEAKARLVALLGQQNINTLENSHVLVVGCGGVGGACAEALVRGRVGELSIIDGDKIESSNINRQAVAFVDTVGMRKVDAFEKLALNVNPNCKVHKHDTYLTLESIETTLDDIGAVDYICDCMDSLKQKISLYLWAQKHNIPVISAMGAAKHYDPTALKFADIYETQNCPVAKIIRKNARKAGIKELTVLYSTEKADTSLQDPNVLGSSSYLPPIMGEMIAAYVISNILHIRW